jgi:hypothetical protein
VLTRLAFTLWKLAPIWSLYYPSWKTNCRKRGVQRFAKLDCLLIRFLSKLVFITPILHFFPPVGVASQLGAKNCLQSHHNRQFGFPGPMMANLVIFSSWFFCPGLLCPLLVFNTLLHPIWYFISFITIYCYIFIIFIHSLLFIIMLITLFYFIKYLSYYFSLSFHSFLHFYTYVYLLYFSSLFHIFLLFIFFFSSYSYFLFSFSLFLLTISLLLLLLLFFFNFFLFSFLFLFFLMFIFTLIILLYTPLC